MPFLFSSPQRLHLSLSLCIVNHPILQLFLLFSLEAITWGRFKKLSVTMKWNQKVPPTILSYAAAVEEARAGGGSERDDDVVYIEYLNISPSKILDCASAETREWVYVVSVFIFSMEILLAEVMEPPSLFYACSQKKSEFPFYFNESKKNTLWIEAIRLAPIHTHTYSFCAYIHFYFAHL